MFHFSVLVYLLDLYIFLPLLFIFNCFCSKFMNDSFKGIVEEHLNLMKKMWNGKKDMGYEGTNKQAHFMTRITWILIKKIRKCSRISRQNCFFKPNYWARARKRKFHQEWWWWKNSPKIMVSGRRFVGLYFLIFFNIFLIFKNNNTQWLHFLAKGREYANFNWKTKLQIYWWLKSTYATFDFEYQFWRLYSLNCLMSEI